MRVPVVTRTITTTQVELICLNVESGRTESVVMTFPREPKDDDILKQAKREYETNNFKVVYIADRACFTAKYSMLEDEFIKNAKKIEVEV